MNINIMNYLSDEEIKEMCKDELRKSIRKIFNTEKEITRIITNLSYYELWEEIEKEVPNFKNIIKEKTIEQLNNISSYDVLRRKDIYESKNSVAQDILEKCVIKNSDIIEKKVKCILNALSKTDIKYEIKGIIEDYVEKLFEGDNQNEQI